MSKLQDKDIQLKDLRILVEDTEKSVLCFALYNKFQDVEKVQAELSEQLAIPIVIEGLKADKLNLFDSLEKLGTQNRSVVFMVYQGHTDAELRRVAGFANLQRERLLDYPHVIVFCLSNTAFPKFIEQAPDFWAWRSGGLLDFQSQVSSTEDTDIERVSRSTDNPAVYESYRADAIEKQIDDYLTIIEAQERSKKPDLAYIARTYLLLGNLSGQLGLLDQAVEFSQKAVAISRELNDESLQANALHDLGLDLSNLGQRELALSVTEEAVAIRRKLVENRRDTFLPDLAQSLTNLGKMYSHLGQRELALRTTEEAVEIQRILTESHLDAFLPDLAQSLTNLGAMYRNLGQGEGALVATEEAVEIRRKLVENRPNTFLPDLAQSLTNLGTIYSGFGQQEAALEIMGETIEIQRKLTESRPDAFLPDLALSLNNLGQMYSYIGQGDAALQAVEEAVAIQRKIAESHPDTFLPDLARLLTNLGHVYNNLGQKEVALAVIEEAVITLKPYFFKHPQGFEDLMRVIVKDYSKSIEALERKVDLEFILAIQEKLDKSSNQ